MLEMTLSVIIRSGREVPGQLSLVKGPENDERYIAADFLAPSSKTKFDVRTSSHEDGLVIFPFVFQLPSVDQIKGV